MKILIVGTGYVGLVTGSCFAEMGHHVTCLDTNSEKISQLSSGIVPIYEVGLEDLIKRNRAAHRLTFTTDYKEGVTQAEVIFLCLPTPQDEDGSADVSYVLSASKVIARHLNGYQLIVNKSTVPVGTAGLIKEVIEAEKSDSSAFDVVSNPEFLKEGSAVADCLKPDRIIIGSESEQASAIMRKIYAPFTMQSDRIQMMDITSAELTKYAANAMLATRISFMNELARLTEKVGGDIQAIRKGIGSDQRIGPHFLYAGAGYGGSCFPKDIKALIRTFKDHKLPCSLIEAVEEVNERQKRLLGEKIAKYFAQLGGVKERQIAIWGLSFKPDTDDMREAPSLTLLNELLKQGAKVRLYDPVAMENAKRHIKNLDRVVFCKDEYEAAQGSDAIALLTEWKQFRFADMKKVIHSMEGDAFFDGRNQYSPREMGEMGFDYYPIGQR